MMWKRPGEVQRSSKLNHLRRRLSISFPGINEESMIDQWPVEKGRAVTGQYHAGLSCDQLHPQLEIKSRGKSHAEPCSLFSSFLNDGPMTSGLTQLRISQNAGTNVSERGGNYFESEDMFLKSITVELTRLLFGSFLSATRLFFHTVLSR